MTKWTLQEFTDVTKVIRMLYGVQSATFFFEKNFEEMTGLQLNALHKLNKRAKVSATLEKITE